MRATWDVIHRARSGRSLVANAFDRHIPDHAQFARAPPAGGPSPSAGRRTNPPQSTRSATRIVATVLPVRAVLRAGAAGFAGSRTTANAPAIYRPKFRRAAQANSRRVRLCARQLRAAYRGRLRRVPVRRVPALKYRF